jgi:hypothetical protein
MDDPPYFARAVSYEQKMFMEPTTGPFIRNKEKKFYMNFHQVVGHGMDHCHCTAGIADSLVHEEDVLANLKFNFQIRSKLSMTEIVNSQSFQFKLC